MSSSGDIWTSWRDSIGSDGSIRDSHKRNDVADHGATRMPVKGLRDGLGGGPSMAKDLGRIFICQLGGRWPCNLLRHSVRISQASPYGPSQSCCYGVLSRKEGYSEAWINCVRDLKMQIF